MPGVIQEVEEDSSPPTALELTPVETTLRRLLLDVANWIDESASGAMTSQIPLPQELVNEKLVLRFTGGWVRDKLLGVPSHDIDVAINKMTGEQFGLKMKEYLEIEGNPEKYGLEGVATTDKQSQKAGVTEKSKLVGGLHKIEANPEKSKHLETVTTKILGLDIDLVNLRKETYGEDSRNPQMEFGSPEEDALRRDATVNAMFYNLNTQQIEDLTGRGHDDMRDKIIRTPLEPYQTFKDDPLRVLRLIRFASRLGYKIDPDALVSMSNADIKDNLRRKISRERVGIELEKALRGPDPHEALRLIFELGLYFTIFSDPALEGAEHYQPDTARWQVIIDCLEENISSDRLISKVLAQDGEERFMAWQLAALVPYRDAPPPQPSAPGRKTPPPVSAQVAREGIKATNKVTDVVVAAIRHQSEISRLVDRLYERQRRPNKAVDGENPDARDVLGMAIRRWGPSWRCQVLYSFLVEVADGAGNDEDAVHDAERKYTLFLQRLGDLDLLDACSLKPLLDGKTLAKALSTPPGPWMKDALDVVMAWQLRHPGESDPSRAIEDVQHARTGELSHALARHFLQLTIRPLFAKARPTTITSAGRKRTAELLPEKMTAQSMDEAVAKPWKTDKEAGHGIDLLRWTVMSLDDKLLEEVWPLVVPPVLTLLDDWEVRSKTIGATLLHTVLTATPPAFLARTGLGDVFEQALLPCLTFLPTLTPEDESTALLRAVYPALLALSRVRYPPPSPASSPTSPPAETLPRARVRFLDALLRRGVCAGAAHCAPGSYPRLAAVQFDQLARLLDDLGLESVKHLPHVLPMLSDALARLVPASSPASSAAAVSAVRATQALVANAWPRMAAHRGEVLKGLVLCWLNVDGRLGEGVERLRGEVRTAVEMLKSAVGGGGGGGGGGGAAFEDECATLVAADARLESLFAPTTA